MNGITPACLLLWLLAVIALRRAKPALKGKVGEQLAISQLERLPERRYLLLNNVLLPTQRGTTQIDHIVLSVYGVFVIETKNYRGQIYGSTYSEEWTQNIYGKKTRFRNPLKQNYGHICALREILPLSEEAFIPIAVFSDRAFLNVQTDREVVCFSQLRSTVTKYRRELLAENALEGLKDLILSASIESTRANSKAHAARVRENIRIDQAKIKHMTCPRCGGQLVRRSGQYGSFLGCANFPRCRFTRQIKGL